MQNCERVSGFLGRQFTACIRGPNCQTNAHLGLSLFMPSKVAAWSVMDFQLSQTNGNSYVSKMYSMASYWLHEKVVS